jgi:D-alanyl-D-alanine endopeptidase (penicillin-binding protein 7)
LDHGVNFSTLDNEMKQIPMKAVLSGLVLLCVHASAGAIDGRTSLQWNEPDATAQAAPQALPGPAPLPEHVPLPELSAQSVLVLDQETGQPLLEKNPTVQTPIASITKLMTAMLVIDAAQPLDEKITITDADRDTLKGTGSRLAIGSSYTRGQLLHLALIASDNRAAHALGRTYPGGLGRFVATMNRTAKALGMNNTVYVEPTGLSSGNRSTALDLARLADHAYQNYPEIRHISATGHYTLGNQRVVVKKKRQKAKVYYRPVAFNNTNRFTRAEDWNIGLSKTGFINEAGHCLVMQAEVADRDVIIVLLDARGTSNRAGDATRIKEWLESASPQDASPAYKPASRT